MSDEIFLYCIVFCCPAIDGAVSLMPQKEEVSHADDAPGSLFQDEPNESEQENDLSFLFALDQLGWICCFLVGREVCKDYAGFFCAQEDPGCGVTMMMMAWMTQAPS